MQRPFDPTSTVTETAETSSVAERGRGPYAGLVTLIPREEVLVGCACSTAKADADAGG